MAKPYADAMVAGRVPDDVRLPSPVLGTQRVVRISPEGWRHVLHRHPDWAAFCLQHMAAVLSEPEYVGHRPRQDRRRVEFVRSCGGEQRLILVAVKFLDDKREAWVCTAHPMDPRTLTRRMRTGTLRPAACGP